MYLTRMELNVFCRDTMRLLVSPGRIHGLVETAFPDDFEKKRKLWRIDHLKNKVYLLILSEESPDLSQAVQRYGFKEKGWQTKSYDVLLKRIQDGSKWHFRLVANPTISKANGSGKRGKVIAHTSVKYQKKWLIDHSKKNGFALKEEDFTVVHSQWFSFRKSAEKNYKVSLKAVTYEGVLQVTDAEKFKHALSCGIGREKAYGMGMLTIVQ